MTFEQLEVLCLEGFNPSNPTHMDFLRHCRFGLGSRSTYGSAESHRKEEGDSTRRKTTETEVSRKHTGLWLRLVLCPSALLGRYIMRSTTIHRIHRFVNHIGPMKLTLIPCPHPSLWGVFSKAFPSASAKIAPSTSSTISGTTWSEWTCTLSESSTTPNTTTFALLGNSGVRWLTRCAVLASSQLDEVGDDPDNRTAMPMIQHATVDFPASEHIEIALRTLGKRSWNPASLKNLLKDSLRYSEHADFIDVYRENLQRFTARFDLTELTVADNETLSRFAEAAKQQYTASLCNRFLGRCFEVSARVVEGVAMVGGDAWRRWLGDRDATYAVNGGGRPEEMMIELPAAGVIEIVVTRVGHASLAGALAARKLARRLMGLRVQDKESARSWTTENEDIGSAASDYADEGEVSDYETEDSRRGAGASLSPPPQGDADEGAAEVSEPTGTYTSSRRRGRGFGDLSNVDEDVNLPLAPETKQVTQE
eukprot:GHVU01047651.1.p1 GENE.GHVU01047651.1~~GHVU01047651.1.p1  ORF type:complete len:510 (-),score=37.04 GHVU01047651.1:796-2235(-)